MNLYIYDSRHEQVLDELPITNIAQAEQMALFLEKNGFTTSYNMLVIAYSYIVDYDEGDRYIKFKFFNESESDV